MASKKGCFASRWAFKEWRSASKRGVLPKKKAASPRKGTLCPKRELLPEKSSFFFHTKGNSTKKRVGIYTQKTRKNVSYQKRQRAASLPKLSFPDFSGISSFYLKILDFSLFYQQSFIFFFYCYYYVHHHHSAFYGRADQFCLFPLLLLLRLTPSLCLLLLLPLPPLSSRPGSSPAPLL